MKKVQYVRKIASPYLYVQCVVERNFLYILYVTTEAVAYESIYPAPYNNVCSDPVRLPR